MTAQAPDIRTVRARRSFLQNARRTLATAPLSARPISRAMRPVVRGVRLDKEGRRVYVAEASLIDSDGEEVGRGTGTFMRSQFPLSSLPGYAA